MGGIGNKPAALFFGGLQPLGQVVEFVCQYGQLVMAADTDLLVIAALLNDVHGVENCPHPVGKMPGIQQSKEKYPDFQYNGDAGDGVQQQINNRTLGGVVFRHIHAAGNGPVADDGGGGPGDHGAVMIFPGEYIVSVAGAQNFRQKGVAAQRSAGAVIDAQARLIRNNEPGGPQTFQLAQNVGNGGIVPNIQSGKLVGGKLAFFDHGAFLILVEKPLAQTGAHQVQGDQDHGGDDHIGHGVVELGGTVAANILIC